MLIIYADLKKKYIKNIFLLFTKNIIIFYYSNAINVNNNIKIINICGFIY